MRKVAGIKAYYPTGNYVFVDISKASLNSNQLEEKLARQGILIRNCNTYSGLKNNFIRLAVKSKEDNQLLIRKLKYIIKDN